MAPTSQSRSAAARACVAAFVALALAACSLVLDEPTPFVEARRDAAELDRGPLLPDLAVEDAFVARPQPDMAADAAPCPDGGCVDGGM